MNFGGFGRIRREDLGRGQSFSPEFANAEGIGALGEADPFFVEDQLAVEPSRVGEAEGAIEQDLARGGFQEVGASHDFGDLHGRVIGYASKLITW